MLDTCVFVRRACVRSSSYDTACVANLRALSLVCAYGGRACVRRLTIPHAWPTCVRSLSRVCVGVRACVRCRTWLSCMCNHVCA